MCSPVRPSCATGSTREDIGEIPAGLYPGDYLIPVGKALADEYGTKF